MGEIAETVSEAVEKAGGEGEGEEKPAPKLNTMVAMAVAIAATFMALCNVKGGNVDQAMAKTQVEIVDTWSFFQAKSTKESLAEASADQLELQRDPAKMSPEQLATLDKQIASYKTKVARYEKEKGELQTKVEALQKEYERLNVKDDQFDITEALISVGIALFGITALTQKRWMLFVAGVFAGFGMLVGLGGFLGWNIRPEWLAKLVGV